MLPKFADFQKRFCTPANQPEHIKLKARRRNSDFPAELLLEITLKSYLHRTAFRFVVALIAVVYYVESFL